MSNYRRAKIAGGTFFFTVVTHDRTPYFADESAIQILRAAFAKVKTARPFEIEAIVVMPDHLHCIWRLPTGDDDYSGRWREIKKIASRQLDPVTNLRNKRPVWQRRFWEHAIRDQEDCRRHMDYVHYNPVKHGLARRPIDWPWSSFKKAVAKGWYEPAWGSDEPAHIAGLELE